MDSRNASPTATSGQCVNVPLLSTAWDFDLAPDGRHVYVASYFNDAVAILRRDQQTGLLSQSVVNAERCISPIRPECKPVSDVRIQGPIAVDVSPDGRFVYIASVGQDPTGRDVVASFARDSENGELTPVAGPSGCMSASGSGGQCVGSPLGNSLRDLLISPDGRTLYLSDRGSVVVDPANGTLAEGIVGLDGPVLGGGTWSGADSSFSPGGRFLYSLGRAFSLEPSGEIADLTPDTPAEHEFGSFPGDSEVSPDGRNVYVVVRHGDYGKSVLKVMNVAPAEVGLGKLKRRPNGSARLAVTVPDAGTLALAKTKLVKGVQLSAAGPQTVQLKVVPGAKARRKLANNGSARVTLRLNFTTATGQQTETTTRLKLTRGR